MFTVTVRGSTSDVRICRLRRHILRSKVDPRTVMVVEIFLILTVWGLTLYVS